MIEEVIDIINEGMHGLHDQEKILGLTQLVWRTTGPESVDFMPGVIDDDGEAIYAGIDDVNSIMIYHRANVAQLNYKQGQQSGYGDFKNIEDGVQFSLISVWDTRKVKLKSTDMLFLLRIRMPQEIKGLGDFGITITPTSSSFNTKQIFESEYKIEGNYLLPNFINFIQLNYIILFKYNPQCIQKCIHC